MGTDKPLILFVTDLYYEAQGRVYAGEDLFLSRKLRREFRLCLCHPLDTFPLEKHVDLILIRNTGPVYHYLDDYHALRERLLASNVPVYNSLDGKADAVGKQYLVELTKLGYPVIPSIGEQDSVTELPVSESYLLKPIFGADSIGMEVHGAREVEQADRKGCIVQPRLDFLYEVSFYFVDGAFSYAMYAPDKTQRWNLTPYDVSPDDAEFAQAFVAWNTMQHGIQRVDACRTSDGRLLLMELEDLNPYLSLEALPRDTRDRFLRNLETALRNLVRK